MKIVGFNYSKVFLQRKEKLDDNMTITQNLVIKDITDDKMDISKQEVLNVKFSFTVEYSNDNAKLELEGNVIILPEKSELKRFLNEWKDKKIPEEYKVDLFNFIMGKCNVKSISLEDEFSLPLHFPTPKLTEKH